MNYPKDEGYIMRKFIAISVSPEEYSQYKEYAEAHGWTVSHMIRYLMRDIVDNPNWRDLSIKKVKWMISTEIFVGFNVLSGVLLYAIPPLVLILLYTLLKSKHECEYCGKSEKSPNFAYHFCLGRKEVRHNNQWCPSSKIASESTTHGHTSYGDKPTLLVSEVSPKGLETSTSSKTHKVREWTR